MYITFLEEGVSINELVRELRRKGARLTFTEDPDGQSSAMALVGEGPCLVTVGSTISARHDTCLTNLIGTQAFWYLMASDKLVPETLLSSCIPACDAGAQEQQ